MGTRGAQIQTANRRPVLRATRKRTHDEHLIETHFTVEDIAAGEREAAFKIERSKYLLLNDQRPESRRIFFNQIENAIRERLALLIPVRLTQRVRSVLKKDAHDVAA